MKTVPYKRVEVSPPKKILTIHQDTLAAETLVGFEYKTIRSNVKIVIRTSDGEEYSTECVKFYDDTPENRERLLKSIELRKKYNEMMKEAGKLIQDSKPTYPEALLKSMVEKK